MTEKEHDISLYQWAFFVKQGDLLDELKALAEPEEWPSRPGKDGNRIDGLASYLDYTYRRVAEQSGVVEADGAAIWNTGLVTKMQEDIFVYALLNDPDHTDAESSQQWRIVAFLKASDYHLTKFGSLPTPATYLQEDARIVINHDKDIRINYEHVLEDNLERFPDSFQKLPSAQRLGLFKGMVELAVTRLKRNHRLAVPQYYRKHGGGGKVQLLIPLGLTDPTKPDVALSLDRVGSIYKVVTVLTLDMAYANARLLAKPESNWLEPRAPHDDEVVS